MRSVILTSLAIAGLVSANQYTIGVGKNEVDGTVSAGLGFDPSRIVIATDPAAIIVFQMLSGTHQVVQTSFDAPCTPSSGGFSTDTVTQPIGTDASAASPTFQFTPSDVTSVLYFADIAGDNCGRGAVFCVNTDEASAQSCSAFRTAAEALGGGTVSSASASASGASSAASSIASSSVASSSAVSSAASSGTRSQVPSATGSGSGSTAPAQSSQPVSGAGRTAIGAVTALVAVLGFVVTA